MSKSAKLQAEQAIVVLKSFLGSGKLKTIAIMVFFMLSFGWFTNASYTLIMDLDNFLQNLLPNLALLLVFPLLLIILVFYAKYYASSTRVDVIPDDKPAKTRALILFLSHAPIDFIENLSPQHKHQFESIELKKIFPQRHSWQMPFEAIRYHLERLEYVVIIPSLETAEFVEKFKELACYLLPTDKPLKIVGYHTLDMDFPKGVDFENIEDLVKATHTAYDYLRKQRVSNRDILIDITGGQKTTTVAGAAVALDAGRLFQYVSTRDYKVRTFDVTYLGEE